MGEAEISKNVIEEFDIKAKSCKNDPKF